MSSPVPQAIKGLGPSLSPSTPQEKPQYNKDPVLVPEASVPVVSPQNPPVTPPPIPGSTPPSSHQNKVPNNKAPVSPPIVPVHIAPAPREVLQNPPMMPQVPPFILPVASPPSKLPRNSQPIRPTLSIPPSNLPEPNVSPVSTPPPSFNWKRDGMPVSAPPNGTPSQIAPANPSPKKASLAHSAPRYSNSASPPVSNYKFPPAKGSGSPASLPPASFHGHHHAKKDIITPSPSSYLVPPPTEQGSGSHASLPPASFHGHHNAKKDITTLAPSSYLVPPPTEQGSFTPLAPLYPPPSDPKSNQTHHAPPLPNPEPNVSPVSTPPSSINWKRDRMPVSTPPNGTPNQIAPADPSPTKAPLVHKVPRYSNSAPPPVSNNKSPPTTGSHSPASLPPASFYRQHHARENITTPAPSSYLVLPPTEQGSFTPTAPLYPPTSDPKSNRRHHAPPLTNPVSPFHSFFPSSRSPVSPAPSQSPTSTSAQTKMPFLSPKISPSRSSPRNLKMPYLPPIQALPPPPPNEDCSSITCMEPLTNTPPGSPCGCVLPMKIGLRLSVALYTFFPLVSELALEIAVGEFMKQSQVRIMGANAASQNPEKTIVLIDLVPLGEKFDSTTAYLISQRFWQKQVAINGSFFGDYEVLYVQYPGLPPSPLSSISIIDGGPYSGHDNNGGAIKPLGVDVHRQRHSNKLNGSVIAIIVLSASVAAILCCAVAWVLLFKHRGCVSHPEPTPPTTLPSLTKSSGAAASMIGSVPISASLSFVSCIATYTGSAKTFSSSDIERATDNFNDLRILGEGGFGRVYSGVLEDGTKVAVKVLKRDDHQGGREFLAEVEMLSRLHHRNLVKLIGICTEERIRCLVYELIPNGSVESHLHGINKETDPLDWGARMKIALGTARGLAYLHEDSSPRVIHRDFKASNILLEYDFMPKVSDFGLARTALDEENRHISTRVMGTFGYVAPEYAMTGHLLVKSDVYSYGVVLLELLTGRKPVDMSQPPGQENLVTWARPLLTRKEGLESIIDPSLGPDFPFDSIAKVAAIASMCVQPEVSHRPFMGEVVQALKLVCNECEETKDLGSRSCSQEDLSIDYDARISTNSGHLPDPLQNHSSFSNYESALDVERGPFMSDFHRTFDRLDSGSYRRHSISGPLRTGRRLRLWERMKRLSGGSVSEHGVLPRFWPGSH